MLGPAIAKSVRFAEAPQAGRSALSTAGRVPGVLAYREIAARLAAGEVPLLTTVEGSDDEIDLDAVARVEAS